MKIEKNVTANRCRKISLNFEILLKVWSDFCTFWPRFSSSPNNNVSSYSNNQTAGKNWTLTANSEQYQDVKRSAAIITADTWYVEQYLGSYIWIRMGRIHPSLLVVWIDRPRTWGGSRSRSIRRRHAVHTTHLWDRSADERLPRWLAPNTSDNSRLATSTSCTQPASRVMTKNTYVNTRPYVARCCTC